MNAGKGRRCAALLLCLAMMFSMVGAASPAAGEAPSEGLCEHHPEHTAECGYIAPSEGSPCLHVHDAACGYAEPAPETPCDKGCADEDGDGIVDHVPGCAYTPAAEGSPCTHVHDGTCGYAAATEGSPCQYKCEICGAAAPSPEPTEDGNTHTHDPEPTEPPADPQAPEGDALLPQGDPGIDEPSADGGIMPTALTEPKVTVKAADDLSGSEGNTIDDGTSLTWEHNKVYKLSISASYSSVAGDKVKITVAPGLKITEYYQNTASFAEIKTSRTTEIDGYAFPVDYDTLEYTVNAGASTISLDVTLAVDTVLWPKIDGWKIENAIQVEFSGDSGTVNKTASVTVARVEDSGASWNKLYVSDSNNSVPAAANKPFRMKIFQVAPNLHGTPMGFYYKELKVTVPYPKLQNGDTYADYDHYEVSRDSVEPTVNQSNDTHTVTFTWKNIYVPAGNTFSFTPYFKWTSDQTAEQTAVFSEMGQLSATATPYGDGAANVEFDKPFVSSPAFTVQGDVAINFDPDSSGGRGAIYNYGSETQVYQLGQFLVRNDGFGVTGPLTLKFTYQNANVARVIAQGIPMGSNSGTVTNITYKTDKHPEGAEATITPGSYRNTDNNHSYVLMAPAGEYFTEIVATISGLPAQTVCYNKSAVLSPGNGAVTYGTMAATAATGDFKAQLEITGDGGTEKTKDYTSHIITSTGKEATQMSVTANGSTPFTFRGAQTRTVQLGTSESDRTIHYSASISATNYPYGNNQVVDKPVIYLRLPNTIEVKAVKLTSVQTGGPSDKEEIISDGYTFTEAAASASLGANFHVYKIEFSDYSGAIGCFNENLGESRLKLEFDMVAAVGIEDVTLKMCDTVFLGYVDKSKINSTGSLASSQKPDQFDVDNDGTTGNEQYFSTMQDIDANLLTIKAPRIGLEFNSAAKLSTEEAYNNFKVPTNNPEDLTAGNHIMYLTGDETIDFRFTAENKTGSPISIESDTLGSEDFYYYIPVPKIGDNWDGESDKHIQDAAFGLDMVLTEEVRVVETGGATGLVQVLYSTTVDAEDKSATDPKHFNNASQISENYKSWDAIPDDEKKDIRMIRISVRQGAKAEGKEFPDGYTATFTIKYEFVLNTEEMVGSAVEFGPCGITSYKRNNTGDSGHTPTQRIRAELQTGRIAGRVFIDDDYSGSYTDADYPIEFSNTQLDPDEQNMAFLDKNENGSKDVDETEVEMDLYATNAAGNLTHYAQKPTLDSNPYKNTYAIPGLRAEEYTLTVTNPGYTADGVLSENSLQFIQLDAETGTGSRGDSTKLAPASTYDIGYRENTTAKITVEGNAEKITANRMRDIGLQRPHKVTFEVKYVDTYGTKPSDPAPVTAYVWHGEAAEDPSIELADDFQWQGGDETAQWTTTDDQAAFGSPINSTEREITYTATAVREEHNVIYDDNWSDGEASNMPATRTAVNGETVTLATEPIPTRGKTSDGKSVVFLGWTSESGRTIVERGTAKKELTDSDLKLDAQVTMEDRDITVYAVWAEDSNGNDKPDVLEDRYTLTYNANGGSTPPDPKTNLLANEEVSLGDQGSTTAPADPEDKTVVFVGWSENDVVKGKIYGQTDSAQKGTIDGYVKTSVVMPADDKTVYAVWAYDENNNTTPDYQEDAHYGVQYDTNGGGTPDGLTTAQNTSYLPETTVTLWQPTEKWTKGSASAGTQAVFVGWCATDMYGEDPVKTDPTADLIITAKTPAAGSGQQYVTVYAVWAEDKNGNGTADYGDPQITIEYNLNEGSGAGPFAPQTGLVAGASYTLEDGSKLTRVYEDLDHPAVFVGWSRTKPGSAIPESVTPEEFETYGILETHYTIPVDEIGDTITLYAVYGEDNNGDNIADYREKAHQVAYYPNGGQDPKTGVALPEPFYTCPHHHVAGENADLMEVAAMAGRITRENAVLIGWSTAAHGVFGDTADDKTNAETSCVSTVLIPEDDADEPNAKVYAVWAEDKNGNHFPDYNEDHFKHTYYYNAALTDWEPDPDSGKMDPTSVTENAMPAGVTEIRYGDDHLPATEENILIDTCIDMAGPVLKTRTDLADGTELHHYVQLGWSGYCHPAATSRLEANKWLIETNDEDKAKPGAQRKIAGAKFQFAFAVWALDENQNGVADFDEAPYTLHYDLNGGSGEVPEDQTYLPGLTLELDTASAPVRTQAIFLGWSTVKHEPAVSQAEADAWKAETVTLPAESAEPGKNVVTVYALWAINENAAGDAPDSTTPDYRETHSLTYDANPIVGAVSGMPETLSQEYAYGTEVTVTDAKPTHGDVDGKPVVFVGWSDGKAGLARAGSFTIYHAGDKLKIGAYDLTLYAVWTFGEEPADESDTAERTDGAPGTGDEARPELWAALLGLCALAPACLAVPLTKKRRTGR